MTIKWTRTHCIKIRSRQVVRCKNSFHLKVLQDLFLNKHAQGLIHRRLPIPLPNWVPIIINFFVNFQSKAPRSSILINDFNFFSRIFRSDHETTIPKYGDLLLKLTQYSFDHLPSLIQKQLIFQAL